MNAIEARNKALHVNTNERNENFKIAMKAIENAVARGEYCCNVGFTMKKDLTEKLEGMGYKLKQYSDFRDGSYTTISW